MTDAVWDDSFSKECMMSLNSGGIGNWWNAELTNFILISKWSTNAGEFGQER